MRARAGAALLVPLVVGILHGPTAAAAGFGRHYEMLRLDFPARLDPGNVVRGDFDGDGRDDLASGGFGRIVILAGGRGGGFEQPRFAETTENVVSLHARDGNGDGFHDLYAQGRSFSAGSEGVWSLVRFEGRPFGGLVRVALQPLPFELRNLAWGDFDGDGTLDAIGNGTADTLLVFRGIPRGGWEAPSSLPFPGRTFIGMVGIADIDRDGRDDVLVQRGTDTLFVRRGSSNGLLGSPEPLLIRGAEGARFGTTRLLGAGDLNGDGRPELVMDAFGLRVYWSHGEGYPGPSTGLPGSAPSSVLFEDLTGDGQVDLAIVDRRGTLNVYGNVGGGSLGPVLSTPIPYGDGQLFLGPWGGGGASVLAVATNGGLAILAMPLERPVQDRIDLPVLSESGVAAVDLDRDGRPDIVALSRDSSIGGTAWILQGLGNREFGPPLEVPLGVAPGAAQLADVDGDGDTDLLVQPHGRRSLWLFDGRAEPPFLGIGWPVAELAAGTDEEAAHIAVGDMSGDALPDIALLFPEAARVVLLQGLGQGRFGPPREVPFPGSLSGMDLADIEPKPGQELLVLGYSPGFLTTLGLSRDGTPMVLRQQDALSRARGPFVGRLDGDCLPDVLLVPSGDRVAIMSSRGDGTFSSPSSDRLGRPMDSVALVDLDADGYEDLVGVDRVDGIVLCRYARPSGGFSEDEEYSVGGAYAGTSFGDLDGDGFPDLLQILDSEVLRITWNQGGGGIVPGDSPTAGARLSVRSVAPNPGRGRVHVEFLGARRGDSYRFDIVDVQGRRVAGESGRVTEDDLFCRDWDGTTDRGVAVAPGVYFVRLESGGRVATARVVRTP